ncbi:MAG: hypothetical protein HY861_04220 [Chlamydiia bacterium]|nr:hypothetical protein [Chlamydiia bacterium]
MFWQRPPFTVTFATSVWERDWRQILLDPDYLKVRQIDNHCFPFAEKLLVINNVKCLDAVKKAALEKVSEGVLTRIVVAEEICAEMLSFFQLARDDFRADAESAQYAAVSHDWVFYNALGPLSAIYTATSDYVLYLTGDVWLDKRVDWIPKALRRMARFPQYKVANLTWNERYKEARKESYKREWNFFVARAGFSDQMFLVRKDDFCRPIYNEIRLDSVHYPRGDVWEKRVFSYMKNQGWERITYRHGSYIHK